MQSQSVSCSNHVEKGLRRLELLNRNFFNTQNEGMDGWRDGGETVVIYRQLLAPEV